MEISNNQEKFTSKVTKTNNKYITVLNIIELFDEEDDNGYTQIKGEQMQHSIKIEGHNSYNRAVSLSNLINNPTQ